MTERTNITEENDRATIDAWYDEAKAQTPETLPAFIAKLTDDYGHDYGTICHAVTAAGLGAMWAVNSSPAGGITGFQAGCIMWEFIRRWMHKDGPLRLIDYNDLLYPQYARKFTSVDPEAFDAVREKARRELAEAPDYMHPDVRAHMEAIAAGRVPFGLQLEAA